MRIAVIDADLIGRKRHRFPNLACMKLSGFHRDAGDAVELKTDYDGLERYDRVYLSRVFTDTPVPAEVLEAPNVVYGGTGFFYDRAAPLPPEIEHHMPDYHLYDGWVEKKMAEGRPRREFAYYLDYSIGFLTRGCFRKCAFCVNRNYDHAAAHSPLSELDNGNITIHKLFTFQIAFKGATGTAGSSAQWYTGTKITGTSTTATIFSDSGITAAKVGDMYLNTSTQNTYRCTVAGAASAAKWVYVSNIKGATGGAGSSAQWYTGTGITGTSTTATIFSGSGVSAAKVGDMYLNTSTQNTYRCTVAGAADVAKWVYVSNIKGATGGTGPAGADAITMSITSSNGTIFKNTGVSTTLTAHVYKAGVELNATQIAALGTIKWYKDGSSTALSTTGPTLNITSSDVTNKASYIAQLEG